MAFQERFGLRPWRVAEAIDVMVTVALGVGDADQRAEREILLHAAHWLV